MTQALQSIVDPSRQPTLVPQAGERLQPVFRPSSVAVIGASNRVGTVGHDLFRNILLSGYCGTLYPVNPKAASIAGVHAYTSVGEIPDNIDLALIMVPATAVAQVLEECGQKGARGAVIVTAGFKEVGTEGAALERRAVEIAHEHGI